MFSRAGYQRVSVLGKTQKSIDIDLESPVTRRRVFVQVKSQATRAVLLQCIEQFEAMPQYDEFFFVCHTPVGLDGYEPTPHEISHFKAWWSSLQSSPKTSIQTLPGRFV